VVMALGVVREIIDMAVVSDKFQGRRSRAGERLRFGGQMV